MYCVVLRFSSPNHCLSSQESRTSSRSPHRACYNTPLLLVTTILCVPDNLEVRGESHQYGCEHQGDGAFLPLQSGDNRAICVCIPAISQHHRTQAGQECKKKPLLAEEEGEKIAGALVEKPHYSPSAGHVKFFFRRNFSVPARQTAGPDL